MIRTSLDARIPGRSDDHVHFTEDAVRSLVGQRLSLKACGEGNPGDYPPVGRAVVAGATVEDDGGIMLHLEITVDDEAAEKTLKELLLDPTGAFSSEAAVHESRDNGDSVIDAVELLSMWPSSKPPRLSPSTSG